MAPGFADAVIVCIAVGALDQMFFFVPGRLGTLEGARFMVLSLLGVTQVYGLAFGLVARLEQLLWSGMGFLAYGIYPRYVRPVTAPRPVEAIPLPEDSSHTKGTGFPNAYGESL